MLNQLFGKIRQYMFSKELKIYRILKQVFIHIGNVPGFGRMMHGKDCCMYHYIQNTLDIPFEPNFIKIYSGNELIKTYNSSKQHKVRFLFGSFYENEDICNEKAEKLIPVFEAFDQLLHSPNLEYLKFFKGISKNLFERELFFLRKGNSNKIVCLDRGNGWITPVVCSFINLSGKCMPFLNIFWNFQLLNCCYKDGKYLVQDSGTALSIDDFDYEKCDLVEKDIDMFTFEIISENLNSTHFYEYRSGNEKHETTATGIKNLKDVLECFPEKEKSLNKQANENGIGVFAHAILILAHFLLLFSPFLGVLCLSISLQKNFTVHKNVSLIAFILIFTISSIYCLRN